MTEAEARSWLVDHLNVPRETLDRLSHFVSLLIEENKVQNLVSQSSLGQLWARHVVDSAQLIRFAPGEGSWIDLGTGAGFPGLIIAALSDRPVTLVEQRRIRIDFLRRAARAMGILERVTLCCGRVEQLELQPFSVISARAFAPLDRLFQVSIRLAAQETRWVLPKGKNAKTELEAVRGSWQGVFRLEASCTDPDAFIIVAEQVRRKPRGAR